MRIEGTSWAGALCERIDGRLRSDERLKARFEAVGASAPLAIEGSKRIAKGSAKLIGALWSRQSSVRGAVQLLQGGSAELLAAVYALFVGLFSPGLVTKKCRALDIVRTDAVLLGEVSLLEQVSAVCWKQFQGLQRIVERHPVAATLLAGALVYGMSRLFSVDEQPSPPPPPPPPPPPLPPPPSGSGALVVVTQPPELPDLGIYPYCHQLPLPNFDMALLWRFRERRPRENVDLSLLWEMRQAPIVPEHNVPRPLLMIAAEPIPAPVSKPFVEQVNEENNAPVPLEASQAPSPSTVDLIDEVTSVFEQFGRTFKGLLKGDLRGS